MTREESISELLGHIDCHDEETNISLEMAISAIREQEERSKGCDFCNERNVAVMSASILTFDLKHHGCMCRFCPMCGRKLEVER